MNWNRIALLILLATMWSAVLLGGDASQVHHVLTELRKPREETGAQRYELAEEDINAWTEVAVRSKKRLGVQSVDVDFRGRNRFVTTAKINMDEVDISGFSMRLFKSVLSGVQTLIAEGRLQIRNRRATYEVESASFNGITVPAWVVNSVVSYLTKNQPPHVDVTEPFALPFEVRDVQITPDSVIIQR